MTSEAVRLRKARYRRSAHLVDRRALGRFLDYSRISHDVWWSFRCG
jgi:hypothetical protein